MAGDAGISQAACALLDHGSSKHRELLEKIAGDEL
jgi:hypothetical protein